MAHHGTVLAALQDPCLACARGRARLPLDRARATSVRSRVAGDVNAVKFTSLHCKNCAGMHLALPRSEEYQFGPLLIAGVVPRLNGSG